MRIPTRFRVDLVEISVEFCIRFWGKSCSELLKYRCEGVCSVSVVLGLKYFSLKNIKASRYVDTLVSWGKQYFKDFRII